MSGPLSRERVNTLRRVSRRFGYSPNLEHVWCLLDTVDKAHAELDEVYEHLAMTVEGRRILEQLGETEEPE